MGWFQRWETRFDLGLRWFQRWETRFPDGVLVDELYAERVDLELVRWGQARYRLDARGETDVSLELWTSKVGQIAIDARRAFPAWVRATYDEAGTLEKLSCQTVDVHLEHLDRGAYFLGVSHRSDHGGLALSTRGDLKARLRSDSPSAARPPAG